MRKRADADDDLQSTARQRLLAGREARFSLLGVMHGAIVRWKPNPFQL